MQIRAYQLVFHMVGHVCSHRPAGDDPNSWAVGQAFITAEKPLCRSSATNAERRSRSEMPCLRGLRQRQSLWPGRM
jgi:hypothetical protein